MVKKADIPNQIIETAFRLAAERGWRDLSLAEIAEAAGLPLSKVYPVFPSKAAILRGLMGRIDAAMLAETDREAGEESTRDRLFEVVMRRFDALQPYRDGLRKILADQTRDPAAALCMLPALAQSMALTLEAAGLSTTGLRGALRVKGLSAIYLATLRAWLRDDSEDLAKTMAALDGYLGRVEALIRRVPGPCRAAG